MLQFFEKFLYFTVLLNDFNKTIFNSYKIKHSDLDKLSETHFSYIIYTPIYFNFYFNINLGNSIAYHAGIITKHGVLNVNFPEINLLSLSEFLKNRSKFFLIKPKGDLDEIHKRAEHYIYNEVVLNESFNIYYNCEYFIWNYICKDKKFLNNYSQYTKFLKSIQCLLNNDYLFCKDYLDNKEYEITYYEIV